MVKWLPMVGLLMLGCFELEPFEACDRRAPNACGPGRHCAPDGECRDGPDPNRGGEGEGEGEGPTCFVACCACLEAAMFAGTACDGACESSPDGCVCALEEGDDDEDD